MKQKNFCKNFMSRNSTKFRGFHKFSLLLAILLVAGMVNGLSNEGQGSSPFFNADYDETFGRSTVSLVGQDKYPLVCDLDSGTEKELITYEGNTLYVYGFGAGGLEAIDSYNTGKPIYGVECVVATADPELTDRRIFVIHNDSAVTYGLSNEAIVFSNSLYTFPSAISQSSDPFCVERFGTDTDFYCAFGDGSQIFFVTSGTVIGEDSFNITQGHSHTDDLILDIDNSLIYYTAGTNVESCDILSARSGGSASCSTLKTIPRSGGAVHKLVGYDQAFGTSVCNMFYDGSSFLDRIDMSCYYSNSELFTATLDGASTSVLSVPYDIIMYDVDIDGDIDACFNFRTDGSTERTKCYDLSGSEIAGVSQGLNKELRGIGNVKEIDNPFFIYYDVSGGDVDFIDIDNSSNTDTVAFDDNRHFILERMDGDGRQEIIGESSQGLVMYNAPSTAVDNITVDTTSEYSGLYGFYDPTCTLTQFDFIAKECIDGLTECTYTNDNTEPYVREKICTDCAGTTAYHCGDWSYTEPKVNCSFDTVGTKQIDIDLFTDTNEGTVAYVFDSFDLTVSNTACDENLIESPLGDVVDGETPTTPTEEEDERVKGLKENMFIILGLMATILAMVSLARGGATHPLVQGVIFTGLTVFFGLISWYPWKYVMIMIVVVIALAVIVGVGRSIGKGGD